MRQWLAVVSERYDKLSLRERVLLGLVLLGVTGFAWNQWLLQPASAEQQRAADRVRTMETRIAELETQIEALAPRQQEDPDAANRNGQRRLSREHAQLDERLRSLTEGFIDPRRMAELLQQMLKRQRGLQLLALESLPVANVLPVTGDTQQEGLGIYRHGLELRLRGSYLDTLAYLQALESLPWRFYWESLVLDVSEAPVTEVTLRVYALSLDENLLGV